MIGFPFCGRGKLFPFYTVSAFAFFFLYAVFCQLLPLHTVCASVQTQSAPQTQFRPDLYGCEEIKLKADMSISSLFRPTGSGRGVCNGWSGGLQFCRAGIT